MAKKVRKPRSQSPRTYAQMNPEVQAGAVSSPATGQPPGDSASPGITASKKSMATSTGKAATVNWAKEYRYVYGDLRRTFILAVALLLVLIALNVAFRLM